MALQWHAGNKSEVCKEVHRIIGLKATDMVYPGASGNFLFVYSVDSSIQAWVTVTKEQWRDPAELAQRLHVEYIQKLIAGDSK